MCAVFDNRLQVGVQVPNGFVSRCYDIFMKYGYTSSNSQDDVLLSYIKIFINIKIITVMHFLFSNFLILYLFIYP